jgi:hypothetical protein
MDFECLSEDKFGKLNWNERAQFLYEVSQRFVCLVNDKKPVEAHRSEQKAFEWFQNNILKINQELVADADKYTVIKYEACVNEHNFLYFSVTANKLGTSFNKMFEIRIPETFKETLIINQMALVSNLKIYSYLSEELQHHPAIIAQINYTILRGIVFEGYKPDISLVKKIELLIREFCN